MSLVRPLVSLSLIGLLAAPTSGCIGSFSLTKMAFEWNRDLGDIVVQEVVFLAMVIVPVYGATLFLDGVVFNLIEFITGDNPIASAELGPDTTVAMSREGRDVRVVLTEGETRTERVFRRKHGGWRVEDAEGLLVATALPERGGLVIRGPEGQLLSERSAVEVAAAVRAWRTGGPSAVVATVGAQPMVWAALP